jgi:hypothetical protein
MRCFVIMPFGNSRVDPENARKLDSIYSQWIKPTVESISIPGSNEKITCHRADKTYKPGEIITHVIENLVSSDIVVADLSGRNPNVFYELGVRHAVSNNCILIANDLDDIPFDLRPLRTITYQYEPESMLQLKDSLEKSIHEILQAPNEIDNPVRRYLFNKELDLALQSSEPSLIKSVVSEMALLRNEFTAQTNEIRQIMNLITSKKPINVNTSFDIKSFEGTWKDELEGSIFYARIFNGEPLVPYSYGGGKQLTGHLYNCKIIDRTILGRFEWFEEGFVSGYMYLRLENDSSIKGGWWYIFDVPKEVSDDLSQVNDTLPKMTKLSLIKISSSSEFPLSVQKYFSDAEKRLDSHYQNDDT